MPKETPFAVVSRKLLDTWLASDPNRPADAIDIYRSAVDLLSVRMRLTLIRVDEGDPWQWRMRAIRTYGFASRLLDMSKLLPDGPLGDVSDRQFMEHAVVPRMQEVIQTQQPVIEVVKTRVMGLSVGYDRIMLPQKNVARPEWVLTCTMGRFMFVAPQKHAELDLTDESIVQLLVEGATAKEIAAQINVSPRTVEHRLERMKDRMGARNLVQLTAMLMAHRLGHFAPDPDTTSMERKPVY
jgi:DNA-binding CsgD family transcriptional regulator